MCRTALSARDAMTCPPLARTDAAAPADEMLDGGGESRGAQGDRETFKEAVTECTVSAVQPCRSRMSGRHAATAAANADGVAWGGVVSRRLQQQKVLMRRGGNDSVWAAAGTLGARGVVGGCTWHVTTQCVLSVYATSTPSPWLERAETTLRPINGFSTASLRRKLLLSTPCKSILQPTPPLTWSLLNASATELDGLM